MSLVFKNLVGGLLLLLLSACSHYVTETIPPLIDLRDYQTVAVVDFHVAASSPTPPEVTHRFLAAVHSAQPGVKILELGNEQQVLRSINRNSLDIDAIRQIGAMYGVDAVLTGEMKVRLLQPSLSLNRDLTQLKAKSEMKGELNARVRETANGATAWTNGAHGTWSLGGFSLDEHGLTGGRMNDVNAKNEEMLSDLVDVATRDFRSTYHRRKVD